jgi:hypothetical protein
MMWKKRNRRLQSQGGVAPWLVAGFILLAATGLSYVWINGQTEMLGRELRRLDDEHGKLVKQHLNEEYRWARLKSPQSLEKALADHQLAMGAPRHDQVVRMRDTQQGDGRMLAAVGARGIRGGTKTTRD